MTAFVIFFSVAAASSGTTYLFPGLTVYVGPFIAGLATASLFAVLPRNRRSILGATVLVANFAGPHLAWQTSDPILITAILDLLTAGYPKEITPNTNSIKTLASKSGAKEITPPQGELDFEIEIEREVGGIGMGVLGDGTPYLNQRGLAVLCGVQNAHIGTISAQWNEEPPKPRIAAIKSVLEKAGYVAHKAHIEIMHKGVVHYCYPAEICLAILEYYAFDAGPNIQEQARDNFRLLAGSKLRELIYSQLGYDPTGKYQDKFRKWHERIELNYQSAPRGFFNVFNEAHTIIYEMIQAGADIGEKTVVDISIGLHWSKYWDANGLAEKYGARTKYPHRYPTDHPQSQSNPQESWCYPLAALGEYREWLQNEYIEGGKFRHYLDGKVRKGDLPPSMAQLALDAIEQKLLPPNSG